jgi:hypothetical protein
VPVTHEDPSEDVYGTWTEATGFLRLVAHINMQIHRRRGAEIATARSKLSVIREAGHPCEVTDRFDESVSGGEAADQNG